MQDCAVGLYKRVSQMKTLLSLLYFILFLHCLLQISAVNSEVYFTSVGNTAWVIDLIWHEI